MRKTTIKPDRRDYLKFSIWMEMEDLQDKTMGFAIVQNEHQIRLRLNGDNIILINFHESDISWYKCYTGSNELENNKLFEIVGDLIQNKVSDDKL